MKLQAIVIGAVVSALSVGCGRMPTPVDAGCVGITCPIGGGFGGGTSGGGGGGGTTGGGGGTTGGGGGTTGGGAATGGGTGGGTTGGGGGTTGGGTGGGGGIPTTIAAARAATFPAEVNLTGVVVTAISFAGVSASSGADCTGEAVGVKGVNASFWVADPANPQQGIWVSKFRCDGAIDGDPKYFPVPGDVVDIRGIVGFDSQFNDRTAFRVVVQSEYNYLPSSMRPSMCETGSSPACRPLIITRTGSMVPPAPIAVANTFGMGGALKAEQAYAGARITIMGPVSVQDIYPLALKRISALPNDDRYYGYQLNNGVLVNDFRTFNNARLEDGGTSNCDVRYVILDGGMMSFPNGITGVWDSYAHAACADGGTDSQCFKNRALVPGLVDAGLAYTNVLFPTDCADLNP